MAMDPCRDLASLLLLTHFSVAAGVPLPPTSLSHVDSLPADQWRCVLCKSAYPPRLSIGRLEDLLSVIGWRSTWGCVSSSQKIMEWGGGGLRGV